MLEKDWRELQSGRSAINGPVKSSSTKRIGRPLKAPIPGKRVSLGLKVTPSIKEKLDRAAREGGRTQSQEAEVRLERSFDRDELRKVLRAELGKR